jgi:serine carboxypeptidase 1
LKISIVFVFKEFTMKAVLVTFLCVTAALARKGYGPTEQEWGYVEVREGAHIFWWLQQTSADVDDYTEKPLLIWLQGGPGSSSTGYGNFAELGPLDADLNPRNTSWINFANVLFVDNPVGTGFSYADNTQQLATTNRQIADDFLVLLQGFYEAVPALKSTPLYIFCESYGGKMTAEIALVLDQAIKDGTLDVDLRGVGLGDSWISPIDSVMTWGPYLLSVGAIDQNGYEQIQQAAEATKEAVESGDFTMATNLWAAAEGVVEGVTANIDFYNILTKVYGPWNKNRKLIKPGLRDEVDDKIDVLMNNDVKEALGLDASWGYQSGFVFDALYEDFMKPVTDIVEELLNTTDLNVAVYNGQLDLIVDTPGTVEWVDKLKFEGAEDWKLTNRKPIVVNDVVEGYYKKLGNLGMYWVDRAGHMVPRDNPAAMEFIIEDVASGQWNKK